MKTTAQELMGLLSAPSPSPASLSPAASSRSTQPSRPRATRDEKSPLARGSWSFPAVATQVGRISAHPKGFGFVRTEEGLEYFVPANLMRQVLPGDLVAFELEPSPRGQDPQARPVGLLHRRSMPWQGTLELRQDQVFLVPDSGVPCFANIQVEGLTDAYPGLYVSVRVDEVDHRGPSQRPTPLRKVVRARLQRIVGNPEEPGFMSALVLARYDFEAGFSREALQLACELSAKPIEVGSRSDLRQLPLATIDGESTRDFDDAVFAEHVDTGFRLVVAIADVSHYIKPGSALDRHARRRGTSVYLPERVVPMLPEELSNGACSLLPEQDRYALALDLLVDQEGKAVSFKFFPAVVRSAARLTYEQVQAGKDCGQLQASEAVCKSMEVLWELYEVLDAARRRRGKLEIETPEPKLNRQLLSNTGVADIGWTHRTQAHKLVEELMLLANQTAAQAIRQRTVGAIGLYRHQAAPALEDWQGLRDLAATWGLELGCDPSIAEVARLVATAPEEQRLKAELTARSFMEAAGYDAQSCRHFSLGMEEYTHFTSPIRRYADLVVHRLLLGVDAPSDEDLVALAEWCSERAKAARLAERNVWDDLKRKAFVGSWDESKGAASGHVVAQGRRGIRLLLPDWQCAVLLGDTTLYESGLRWDRDAQVWLWPEKAAVELGQVISVTRPVLAQDGTRADVLVTFVGRP